VETEFDAGNTGAQRSAHRFLQRYFSLQLFHLVRRQDIRHHYMHKTTASFLQQRFQVKTDGTAGTIGTIWTSVLKRLTSLQMYINLHKSLSFISATDDSSIIPAKLSTTESDG